MEINGRKFNVKRTGFIRSDYPYKHVMKLHKEITLPTKADASFGLKPFNQLDTSSCTSNSACRAKKILVAKYGIKENPSRKFHYNCELIQDGDHDGDNGSSLRTSMDILLKIGVCDENLMPFDGGKNILAMPTPAQFNDAIKYKIGAYYAVENEYQMKHALSRFMPVVMGIDCPRQLLSSDFNGVLENLSHSDKVLEGGYPAGHALCIDGYEDDYFWITNSWGEDWGPFNGRFKIHKSIMFNPYWCSDFFTPRLAGQPGL